MICRKVNKTTMSFADNSNYIASNVYDIDEVFSYVEVPEGLDPDCVIIQVSGEQIQLVEDPLLVKEKSKTLRILALNNQTWETILIEGATVYGIDPTGKSRLELSILESVTAQTISAMVSNPSQFVLPGVFENEEAVLAYATPKLAASNAFGLWRIGKLEEEAGQKASIEAE